MQKQELIKAYHELANREEHFRTIAEFAPVMLWVTDRTGKSQFLNKKWLKFTGCNDDNDSNSVWMDALHPSERKKCLASFQSAFKAQLPFQMEYQLRCHDGEYRWILDIGEPKIEHRGQKLGTITISIGAALIPMHGDSPDSLLNAADTAMYAAKHKGRDQVVLGQKSLSAPLTDNP